MTGSTNNSLLASQVSFSALAIEILTQVPVGALEVKVRPESYQRDEMLPNLGSVIAQAQGPNLPMFFFSSI